MNEEQNHDNSCSKVFSTRTGQRYRLRSIAEEDAAELCRFYNALSDRNKHFFNPLGPQTTQQRCLGIVEQNHSSIHRRDDLIVLHEQQIIGWVFLVFEPTWPEEAELGIGIDDAHHGHGLGHELMQAIVHAARRRQLARVRLRVFPDNHIAISLYKKHGFIFDYHERPKDGPAIDWMVKAIRSDGCFEQNQKNSQSQLFSSS